MTRYNCVLMTGLLLAVCQIQAAPQEIVLRPDLPAGEEWYTPPGNQRTRQEPDREMGEEGNSPGDGSVSGGKA